MKKENNNKKKIKRNIFISHQAKPYLPLTHLLEMLNIFDNPVLYQDQP